LLVEQSCSRTAAEKQRFAPIRRALINLALIGISAILGLAAIEVASRIYLAHYPPPYLSNWEFRSTRPLAYRDAPYFSREFLDESRRATLDGKMDKNRRYMQLEDLHGTFINVAGGFRVTTDVPPNPQRRLWLFGASNTFNAEVPDALTIASQLQRMLNRLGTARWEVRNMGLSAITIRQQLELLKDTMIDPGDIVVFYDGGIDINIHVYEGVPPGEEYTYSHLPLYKRLVMVARGRLGGRSAAVKLFFGDYSLSPPERLVNATVVKENATRMAAAVERTLTEADTLVRAKRATFLHFLQPWLLTLASPHPYELTIINNPLLTPPGNDVACAYGRPALRAAGDRLRKRGLRAFDLSDAFDGRPEGDEIFLDLFHVNHRGSEIIAQRIFDRLLDEQLL
jgi:hypothetical protein